MLNPLDNRLGASFFDAFHGPATEGGDGIVRPEPAAREGNRAQSIGLIASEGEGDRVTISAAARALAAAEKADEEKADAKQDETQSSSTERAGADSDLSDSEQREVDDLRARDREVRAHEQAHKSAAGDLATGGPSYSFTTGPDGRRYATGGEVQISLRRGRDPAETVRNMQRAQRAALAPQEPSPQDRAVAAEAARIAAQARSELQSERDAPDEPATE